MCRNNAALLCLEWQVLLLFAQQCLLMRVFVICKAVSIAQAGGDQQSRLLQDEGASNQTVPDRQIGSLRYNGGKQQGSTEISPASSGVGKSLSSSCIFSWSVTGLLASMLASSTSCLHGPVTCGRHGMYGILCELRSKQAGLHQRLMH